MKRYKTLVLIIAILFFIAFLVAGIQSWQETAYAPAWNASAKLKPSLSPLSFRNWGRSVMMWMKYRPSMSTSLGASSFGGGYHFIVLYDGLAFFAALLLLAILYYKKSVNVWALIIAFSLLALYNLYFLALDWPVGISYCEGFVPHHWMTGLNNCYDIVLQNVLVKITYLILSLAGLALSMVCRYRERVSF